MQPELTLTFDKNLADQINQRIEILSLPASSRKRIFQNTGRQILKADRDNIRQQKTVTGEPMKKKKYGRGKALKKMGKGIKFKASQKNVSLSWPNRKVATIAARHQFGIPEVFTARRMLKIHGTPDYDQPASKKQAKALINNGFRIKVASTVKGRKAKSKKPSQKWIVANITMGRAGLLLRTLQKTESPSKRWNIKVPERPFFGVTSKQASDMLASELNRERERRTR